MFYPSIVHDNYFATESKKNKFHQLQTSSIINAFPAFYPKLRMRSAKPPF